MSQTSNKSVVYNYDNRSLVHKDGECFIQINVIADIRQQNNWEQYTGCEQSNLPLHLTLKKININNWASWHVYMTKKGVYGASENFIYFPEMGVWR